ncbi:unnamed protein product [Lasius platythorax]|uniref:Copia protein n=1 Tax=Lasius platythorax TaxID=488582 RepID=A0AAV2NLR7_9HYME
MEEKLVKSVTRLDSQNYQLWKFQMNALLIANSVFDIVTGAKPMPGNEAANAAARKKWLKENAKAMLLISTSIEDSQLESLLTCATAKAMWDTLSNIHEQKTETNKLILTQKFHEYRMSSSDSVVQHVAKVRNLASALKDVREVVFDVAIMAKILASLPSKFNALKTAPGTQSARSIRR